MKVYTKWIQNFLLSALKDCQIISPASGQILYFDGANWINKNVPGLELNFSFHEIASNLVVIVPVGQNMRTHNLSVDGTLVLEGALVIE